MPTLHSLLGLCASAAWLIGCGAAEPSPVITNANVYASAIGFRESAPEYYWACVLSGSYTFPGWSSAGRVDLADLYFSRQLIFVDGRFIARDTLLRDVPVTLTTLSPTQIQVTWGPPLNQTQLGSFTSDGLGFLYADWLCPPDLPFATDSALLAAGYAADSLLPGYVRISRVVAK